MLLITHTLKSVICKQHPVSFAAVIGMLQWNRNQLWIGEGERGEGGGNPDAIITVFIRMLFLYIGMHMHDIVNVCIHLYI